MLRTYILMASGGASESRFEDQVIIQKSNKENSL
jgi:hypothetical protein